MAAPVVSFVEPGGAAEKSGIRESDLIVTIGGRRVKTPSDAVAALTLASGDTSSVVVELLRDGKPITRELTVSFEQSAESSQPSLGSNDCPHPALVCQMRQAVFPISSFAPVGSATRIGKDLLVTNRHVVGDRMDATVHTPNGPKSAEVVPSAFAGDLVLLEVSGLPENGYVPDLSSDDADMSAFYTIGADIGRQEVRVFDPGVLIALPAETSSFSRLHVTASMDAPVIARVFLRFGV